ncbi:MAG: cysteine hydrolase family protein [Draconibacterium sp.]
MNNKTTKAYILVALIFASVFAVAKNPLSGKYVLVIDIQEIWTRQLMSPEESKLLIENVNSIIGYAETEKVIYIETVAANLRLNFNGISVGFPEGLQLDDRLMIVNSNKIIKNKPNSFSSDQLRSFIKTHQASEFVVVGLFAEHCVLETLLGGLKLGYKMAIIPEAIAGSSVESKTKALETSKQNGVEIILLHSI